MRKFLARLFLFGMVLALVVFLVSRYDNTDKNSNSDHSVLKIANATAFDSLDILFIGNSYCYSSVYTPLFDTLGLKTFNLGIASAGPKFYGMMLRDYLAGVKQRPDTVMLLVTPMTFSRKADNWVDYPMHRYLHSPLSNEKLVLEYKAFSDYLPMMVNSARKGFNNLLSKRKSVDRELAKIFLYKGLYIDSTVTNDSIERATRPSYLSFLKDPFDQKGGTLLKNLADSLRRSGMAVIFFETPTHHLEHYFSGDFLNEYHSYLSRISRDYLLIPAAEMPSVFFRNIDHANTQGAYRYTRYLISKLQAANSVAGKNNNPDPAALQTNDQSKMNQ